MCIFKKKIQIEPLTLCEQEANIIERSATIKDTLQELTKIEKYHTLRGTFHCFEPHKKRASMGKQKVNPPYKAP
jgi:hypothetical protein